MSSYYTLMLRVNDPDNGAFTGYADEAALELPRGGGTIRLDGFRMRFRAEPRRFRLGQRVFPCRGYCEWVGNWCWDAVHLDDADTAANVLDYLRERGAQCHEAPEDIYEAWKDPAVSVAGMLNHAAVRRGL